MIEDQIVKIRTARVNDYSACLPLFTSLYDGDIGQNFKPTFEEFIDNKDGIVLLAEHSNKLIGILVGSYHLDIDWEGKITKIDALIVDKALRRRGVGRRLVRCLIAKAKKENCRAVKSRVNRKNRIAKIFHENLGFEKAKTYEYFLDFQEPQTR